MYIQEGWGWGGGVIHNTLFKLALLLNFLWTIVTKHVEIFVFLFFKKNFFNFCSKSILIIINFIITGVKIACNVFWKWEEPIYTI